MLHWEERNHKYNDSGKENPRGGDAVLTLHVVVPVVEIRPFRRNPDHCVATGGSAVRENVESGEC